MDSTISTSEAAGPAQRAASVPLRSPPVVPPEKVREIIHQLMEHNPMLEDMPFVPLEHGPHEKEFLELYEKAQRGVRAAFNPGPKAIRRCRRAARLGLFTAKPRQWFKLS